MQEGALNSKFSVLNTEYIYKLNDKDLRFPMSYRILYNALYLTKTLTEFRV